MIQGYSCAAPVAVIAIGHAIAAADRVERLGWHAWVGQLHTNPGHVSTLADSRRELAVLTRNAEVDAAKLVAHAPFDEPTARTILERAIR